MTPPIDIRADHLRLVQDVLHRHLPDGVTVWVFGSRATWMTKDSSDLDLALDGETEIPRRSLSALEAAFEDSDLPFAVDIVDVKRISGRFREIVAQQRVRLRTGEQASPWPTTPLGNLVNNLDSRRIPLSGRVRSTRPGPYPYYGATGVMDRVDDWLFEGRHLLVAEDGSVETSSGTPFLQLVDGQFWVNNHAHVLQGATDEETRYLYYALSTVQVHPFMSGSVQAKLSQRNLNRIPVHYPPERSQRSAIAHVLGTLDDRIELNRRMNATLEAMARALFRSWFVDFDPVRAKMEGRDPGLPKDIADLFPDRLVDSEIGEIPDGWDVSTIGQEVDVVGGSTPSTKEPSFWNGSINWATPRDLSALASPVLVATSRRITERGLERISSGLLPRGTVLLSSRAPIGYLAIADVPVAINQGFIAMKCGRRLFAVYAWLWAAAHMDEILEKANGSTFLEISKRSFRPLPVVVPSEAVRVVHARFTQSLYDRIVKNERESGVLASVRDVLLPKLVSGKLRVNVRDQAQPADERSIATAGASA